MLNWLRKSKPASPKPLVEDKSTMPLYLDMLVFADVHSSPLVLPDVQPDVVLVLGDISREDLQTIDKRYEHSVKLGILGNHDRPHFFNGTTIRNLHETITTVCDVTFAGFGGAPRYSDKSYGQYTEEEAMAFLRDLERVDVFIAHSNPRREDRPDLLEYEPRAGFASFTEYIQRVKPRHVFHGHIHEQEDYKIGDTNVHSVFGTQRFSL